MNGLCYYELKSRFYGLFNRLPYTYFVTASILLPVMFVVDHNTRAILIELMVYWALVLAAIWLLNDLYTQKTLQEFAFDQCGIYVKKEDNAVIYYTWECLTGIDSLQREKQTAKYFSSMDGVLLSFDDGYTLRVFNHITNYQRFQNILSSKMMHA